MSFNGEYEKLIEKYLLEEGLFSNLGAAIKGTMKKTFIEPWTDPQLNPWAGNASYSSSGSYGKRDDSDSDSGGSVSQKATPNVVNSFRLKELNDPSIPSKQIQFVDSGNNLGNFRLNVLELKNKRAKLNNILIPDKPLTPSQYEAAVKFLAEYDIKSQNIISQDIERKIKTIVDEELKKAKIEQSLFGGKEKQMMQEAKKNIEQLLVPLSLPAQRGAFLLKAMWFFILFKKNILQK